MSSSFFGDYGTVQLYTYCGFAVSIHFSPTNKNYRAVNITVVIRQWQNKFNKRVSADDARGLVNSGSDGSTATHEREALSEREYAFREI
jgi:hypothetical protein